MAPRIVTAHRLGLRFSNNFGQLGPEQFVTGHYTAGPVDKSDAEAARLCRQYHQYHASKGWGGIAYFYCITRKGSLLCLRPTLLKGAHVGGHNTSNVGVMCHGTTGDRPTEAQMRTFRWLLKYAHTRRLPRAHRTDRPLSKARLMGHNSWSGHTTNGCPGLFKRMYLTGGHSR